MPGNFLSAGSCLSKFLCSARQDVSLTITEIWQLFMLINSLSKMSPSKMIANFQNSSPTLKDKYFLK